MHVSVDAKFARRSREIRARLFFYSLWVRFVVVVVVVCLFVVVVVLFVVVVLLLLLLFFFFSLARIRLDVGGAQLVPLSLLLIVQALFRTTTISPANTS